jgi:hypothetical protein
MRYISRKGKAKTNDLGFRCMPSRFSGVISISSETLAEATGFRARGHRNHRKRRRSITALLVSVKSVKVKSVRTHGDSRRTELGVTCSPKVRVWWHHRYRVENGTTVNPAREAGMLPGDVITNINGERRNAEHDTKSLTSGGDLTSRWTVMAVGLICR